MCRLAPCAAIACFAAMALAAPRSMAASTPVTGTLAIQIATLVTVVVGGGGTAVVNGSGGGSHLNTLALPAGMFQTTGFVLPVTDPAAAPIEGVQLTAANAAGTIMSGAGPIPLAGAAKVCLFGPCAAAIANISIPLTVVGAGGAAFTTAAVNITVTGAPWTTGTAAIGTLTQMGFAYGPASAASTTALPSGEIRLVTPIFVSTNIGSSSIIPTWGILTLHFVPEPTTLALVSGGLVLLGASGRARLRAREDTR